MYFHPAIMHETVIHIIIFILGKKNTLLCSLTNSLSIEMMGLECEIAKVYMWMHILPVSFSFFFSSNFSIELVPILFGHLSCICCLEVIACI